MTTSKIMTLSDIVTGPVAVADQPPIPPRDERAAFRLLAEREHERTEHIRALQGLPPLDTDIPEDGACCPWEAGMRS